MRGLRPTPPSLKEPKERSQRVKQKERLSPDETKGKSKGTGGGGQLPPFREKMRCEKKKIDSRESLYVLLMMSSQKK